MRQRCDLFHSNSQYEKKTWLFDSQNESCWLNALSTQVDIVALAL
jgi:hypothetical protein